MKSVFVAVAAVGSLALATPVVVTAQPKRSPAAAASAPTTEPPPEQSAPRDTAIRREPAAPRERAPKATPRTETVRGEATPLTPADNATSAKNSDDQGGQRNGAVRRPPPGASGQGSSPRDRAVVRSGPPPRDYDGDHDRHVYYYPSYYGYSPYYYNPYYYSGFHFGYLAYAPWGWAPAYYGYAYPPAQGYYDYGSLRIKVKERDAEVWVDGFYAGTVDDFDGMFQSLKLEARGYKVEIRKPGFEPLVFDVHLQPDRTITYRGVLRPMP
jgi:hypothetical protein